MALTARFEAALDYAAQVHAKQVRKGSDIPYLSHLLGVASIALQHGADETAAIAALLHDAVEDQGGAPRLAEIRERFGDEVAEIVSACSDTDVLPKPPWRERKEAYIAHIRHASAATRLVSAADKLDNARAILGDYHVIGEELWTRFTGGRDGTLWYYRQLVEAFREAGGGPLVQQLGRTVDEIERLVSAPEPAAK